MGKVLLWIWHWLWVSPFVLVLGGLGLAFFINALGRIMSSPQDPPVAADVIVVLGGNVEYRGGRAVELYQAGYAPRVFLAGPVDDRLLLLEMRGVPASAILLDGKSANTWDEATSAFDLMRSRRWLHALVVSDPPHLRRLSWVWSHVFMGSGMSFRLIAAEMPGWDAGHWWRNQATGTYVMVELQKLAFYVLRYGAQSPRYQWPLLPSHHG
jgi:uncharacterized SAM-binding protein YcdF (DUF218 family)